MFCNAFADEWVGVEWGVAVKSPNHPQHARYVGWSTPGVVGMEMQISFLYSIIGIFRVHQNATAQHSRPLLCLHLAYRNPERSLITWNRNQGGFPPPPPPLSKTDQDEYSSLHVAWWGVTELESSKSAAWDQSVEKLLEKRNKESPLANKVTHEVCKT